MTRTAIEFRFIVLLLCLPFDALAAAPARPAPRTDAAAAHHAGALGAPSICAAKDSDDDRTGCVCVDIPRAADKACWSREGGRWSHAGCKGAMQCCDGAWGIAGRCGGCSCRQDSDPDGCVAKADAVPSCAPPYSVTLAAPDAAESKAMRNVTWKKGCPVPLEQLRVLRFRHWRYDATVTEGVLVVHADVAEKVATVLRRLYRHRFPLQSVRPAREFGGSDDASMQVDNTSAFNCRPITGGKGWSEHAYGRAIDLNPLRNPYVKGRLVLPRQGAPYADRKRIVAGTLVEPGPAVGAFAHIGWGWGGRWRGLQDFQHVSATGR